MSVEERRNYVKREYIKGEIRKALGKSRDREIRLICQVCGDGFTDRLGYSMHLDYRTACGNWWSGRFTLREIIEGKADVMVALAPKQPHMQPARDDEGEGV